ncbi:MAG: sigma 54-interacting transcriptional regulator [Acidobacteria bacterium]|nr:sigma 54-interacting transcriptional regulator [Acidobacteriota bacterium]
MAATAESVRGAPPGLWRLSERVARDPGERTARVAVAVGGHCAGPDGPGFALPAAVRAAAERSLLSGRRRALRGRGWSWAVGGVAEPCPALVAVWGERDTDPARLMRAVETWEEELASSLLPEALQADPLLAVEASAPSLGAAAADLRRIAAAPLNLLLLGPTGAGKEVLARAIHAASRRRGAFVAENCAAIPETLVEAELFGVRRGAFTGAIADREGRIAEAQHGTLFLDEIGDLPLSAQTKLLRALQEGEVRPLGATRPLAVDVRVLAATHRDVRALAAAGAFRSDLFFRLAGAVIEIPALAARRSDLPFLAAALLARLAREGIGPGRRLGSAALRALAQHAWEGNVRELDNLLRRAAALAGGPQIGVADLRLPPARRIGGNLEAAAIRDALGQALGVKADAARRLGWSRQKLYRRLEALGIEPRGVPWS